jgi:hypothetical protein
MRDCARYARPDFGKPDSFPQEFPFTARSPDAQRRPFQGHGKGDGMNRKSGDG